MKLGEEGDKGTHLEIGNSGSNPHSSTTQVKMLSPLRSYVSWQSAVLKRVKEMD